MEVDSGKIARVQDKWNGKLPDNSLLNVLPFPYPESSNGLVLSLGECGYDALFPVGQKSRLCTFWLRKAHSQKKISLICLRAIFN